MFNTKKIWGNNWKSSILYLNLTSPVENIVFGLSDYGFSEVTISNSNIKIKYI